MNCPCCDNKLTVYAVVGTGEFAAYCGFGKCQSIKANVGAFGKTEAEAASNLVDLLEKDPDWKDEAQPEPENAAEIDKADNEIRNQLNER